MICAVKCFWCGKTLELIAHPVRAELFRDYNFCPHCTAKWAGKDVVIIYAVSSEPAGKTAHVIGRQRTLNGDYPTGDSMVVERPEFIEALAMHAPAILGALISTREVDTIQRLELPLDAYIELRRHAVKAPPKQR